MWDEALRVTSLKGSVHACGAAYGEAFEAGIMGFCQQQVGPTEERLTYAERCWRFIEEDAPISAEFMRAMSDSAHLPLEYITLLTLHEEIVHMAHCTAFAASGKSTLDGKTIVAQNWDWPPSIYPWAGLLRLEPEETLSTLTYHMPGLWACAGINQAGVALVWTTTGLTPPVRPEVGIPTYVMAAEVLRRASVEEAIDYIKKVKFAGAFDFLLGDATGVVAVVETVPGYVSVDRGTLLSRANHYAAGLLVHLSRQDVSAHAKPWLTTEYRGKRMGQLVTRYDGEIRPDIAKQILLDRDGDYPWLHQFPEPSAAAGLDRMTLDSFFAVCQDRLFYTARGGRIPGRWQEFTL